jgi:hypothetical protein
VTHWFDIPTLSGKFGVQFCFAMVHGKMVVFSGKSFSLRTQTCFKFPQKNQPFFLVTEPFPQGVVQQFFPKKKRFQKNQTSMFLK